MATGYVLILAVLLLGGVIATLGDRIGMRIGKARLSLFNLRPRQTATLVSILTGSVISASTLALLFAVSRQLRTGVFELEQIQENLAQAEADLTATQAQKQQVESALSQAQARQNEAQKRLRQINNSLESAIERQQATEAQLRQTREQLGQVRTQLDQVSQQASNLREEIQRLRSERQALLQQQESVQAQIAARDREIAARDREIAQREQRLSQLQAQQKLLQEDVARLERQYQGLFRGNVVLARNQPILSGLIRVDTRQEAQQAINQFLQEANQAALQQIAPGTETNRQVLLIPQADVNRLAMRLSDGQEYVVRLLSAGNYVIGEPCVAEGDEPCVQVFFDAVVNELIYQPGERLATVNVDPQAISDQELVEQYYLLIASLQFRARQDGIVGEQFQIADGSTNTILRFLESVQNIQQPLELQAIAAEPIYTTGPLRVHLVAVQDGRILEQTWSVPENQSSDEAIPPE